ncbi:MAG: phosphoenolpyruvate carboxykinase [Bacteroidales bacterium]|nr:phosphoenolpyruvate carboxykinase [Bacteroidales bacterium]
MVYYKIAELIVGVEDAPRLSNMEPFVCKEETRTDMVVSFGPVERPADAEYITGFNNDAGDVSLYLSGDWFFDISLGGKQCKARCSKDFSKVLTDCIPDDRTYLSLINSVIRIAFAQRILFYKGILMHSSVVVLDGKGYMFLGKSGTGKSTHSRLWINAFGAELLNDDNPAVRQMADGTFKVFGTPWSGKTPCYRNASAPLEALVRLEQGKANFFERLYKVKAWTQIFPSCSLILQDEILYLQFEKTANALALGPKVGHLVCLPDLEAAKICREGLLKQ